MILNHLDPPNTSLNQTFSPFTRIERWLTLILASFLRKKSDKMCAYPIFVCKTGKTWFLGKCAESPLFGFPSFQSSWTNLLPHVAYSTWVFALLNHRNRVWDWPIGAKSRVRLVRSRSRSRQWPWPSLNCDWFGSKCTLKSKLSDKMSGCRGHIA